MKYYKHHETGEVYAYENEHERDDFGPVGIVAMTPDEVHAHLNPPTPRPYIPQSVTKAQGKAVLIQSGLWPDVLEYVESIEDATEKALAEVALNDTWEWRRDSPFLNAAAEYVGVTDEQLDQLFGEAYKIVL